MDFKNQKLLLGVSKQPDVPLPALLVFNQTFCSLPHVSTSSATDVSIFQENSSLVDANMKFGTNSL